MQRCPGAFTTETEEELWHIIELHGAEAHGEYPDAWTPQERNQIKNLIRRASDLPD